ncbi:unnamed protein product [Echinostoma caproni]|uniref:Fibronectin type-III domain-containing protein n=1 Tax=Echinostoma caproni TaxID=27848 RepID=A0A183AC68_9TREM|nr:unnamed protein product [Echinostoma caproni]
MRYFHSPCTDLRVPKPTKAELDGKTRILELEFTPISGATSYTVILVSDHEVWQVFHITPDTRFIAEITCFTCTVAVRAVNAHGHSAFSDLFPISSTVSPVIKTCAKYGPFIYPEMETEADDLSPLYEAFLFENNHALASRRWYGYHGRIENSACVMCTLYVRKWHLGQPSTFSQGCRVRAESNDLSHPYFKVDPHPTGFVLEWQSKQPITIIYWNNLSAKQKVTITSSEQAGNKVYLTDLDSCTPYTFEGFFSDGLLQKPWQRIIVVTEPEKPDVKQFTAVSPTKTIIEAQVLTKGYCPLTYNFRGGEIVRGEMRQFIGTPWEIVVSQDTGAVIKRVEHGYSVSVYYEIHNDSGCADRHIIITPTVNGRNIRTAESQRREIAFDNILVCKNNICTYETDAAEESGHDAQHSETIHNQDEPRRGGNFCDWKASGQGFPGKTDRNKHWVRAVVCGQEDRCRLNPEESDMYESEKNQSVLGYEWMCGPGYPGEEISKIVTTVPYQSTHISDSLQIEA